MVLQQVTDSDELSELSPKLQPVTDPNDLSEINSSGDTPWYQAASDKITKVMNAINMGSGYNGPVNDLDSQSAFTVIPEVAKKVGEWASDKIDQKIGVDHPAIGPVVGTLIGTLGAAGAGPTLLPSEPGVQGDISFGLPGTEFSAQYFGGHALGITKKMIKGELGGEEAVNQKIQTNLDQGVISASGPDTMLSKAESVNQQAGTNIHNLLQSAGQDALQTQGLASQLIDKLSEPFSQGLYAEDQATVDKIVDTVMAHGNDGIDLNEAQGIKNIFRNKAGANWNTDAVKASLYQKAYGITGDALEDGINQAAQSGKIPPESLQEYMDNKNIYGASKMAITGLRDRVANEAAQNILSLRGSIIAASALSRGDFMKALEAFGTLEVLSKFGSATGSTIMNKMAGLSVPARSAVIGGLISSGALGSSIQPSASPTSSPGDSSTSQGQGAQ